MRDSSNWKLEVVYQKMKRKLQCSQGNTQGPERSSDYYSRPSGPSEPGGWRRRSPSQILTEIETKPSPWKALCWIVNMSCSFHNSLGLILAPTPGFSDLPTALLLNYCLYYINWKELLHWRYLQYVCESRPSYFSYLCNGLLARLFSFT